MRGWVDENVTPSPHKQLQTDINQAVQSCHLYGASLATLLAYAHKTTPENKQQINNFDGKGNSFRVWLQRTADDYHHHQQLKFIAEVVGGVIGGVVLLVAIILGSFWWYRTWIKGRLKLDPKTGKTIVPQNLKNQGWDTIENLATKQDAKKTGSNPTKEKK